MNETAAAGTTGKAKLYKRLVPETGLVLTQAQEGTDAELTDECAPGYATQLLDDGYASETESATVIEWNSLFAALNDPRYADLSKVLKLPPETSARIGICSRRSLTDHTFEIVLTSWRDTTGRSFMPVLNGAFLSRDGIAELMRGAQWALVSAIRTFARRSAAERSERHNRQAWGRIRQLALAADAHLDDFLYRSVVVTPDRLNIGLRRSEHVADDKVVEITPQFSGVPDSWLSAFDASTGVRDRYDLPTAEGIVQVLITPPVRNVLQQIKRLPGRRVAGARAQAFILNPFATLGEDASEVIDEAQFEEARSEAGLHYESFTPVVFRAAGGFPERVGLLIETATEAGPSASQEEWLDDAQLEAFIHRLRSALKRGFPLLAWEGFEFELSGHAEDDLATLEAVLGERKRGRLLISFDEVHDLSRYSSRIEGLGVEKPYYSPYIAKKDDGEGWFPDNITPIVAFRRDAETEAVAIPTDEVSLRELRAAVDLAAQRGETAVGVSWLPTPVPLHEAEEICRTFSAVLEEVASGTFEPPADGVIAKVGPRKRLGLVVRPNIDALDYEEKRADLVHPDAQAARLPLGLLPSCKLYPHQLEGLAWLQQLYDAKGLQAVRGAVLADDMGLGKTLQLLSLMASVVERDDAVEPMLVVAPVALLENWQEELDKYFAPNSLPLLVAYGEGLSQLRVPRAQIEERLRTEEGLVKFLKPGWVGSAKLVLTTYETLRDLEFSFAAQRWSIMVCDEAQKIKNPAALVTRAAKKQNVRFRVACTGTPVENTLADLWCLFDFVQPGLLGPLNEFGQRYRKPIEARTDEERARVEELRARIAPQILRRQKSEVAKDLPAKLEDPDCRDLPISDVQRALYARAVGEFRARVQGTSQGPFSTPLGLLQYLRRLCTDPQRHGLTVFAPEALSEYRVKAPKCDWLLRQLEEIRRRDEKAIVFCEFRAIQRLLQHYISDALGYDADIINGDTSAAATHIASRQKRLKAFQARPGFGVIILSPLAVGFGVNIQAANHVIHYTRTWNPAKEDQATDRAYRIGQTKDVHVYYPVVVADDFKTFDAKLDELLTSKRLLAADMLNGSGDVRPGEFDVSDLVPPNEAYGLRERVTLDAALRMEWEYFEGLVFALWEAQGYSCRRTPPTKDKGVDIVAVRGSEGVLIQVKSSGTIGAQLNWDAVKEVVAGAPYYEHQYPAVTFAKLAVTNQFFNAQARETAGLNSVRLVDQVGLDSLLVSHEVNIQDVEKVLYQAWSDASMDAA